MVELYKHITNGPLIHYVEFLAMLCIFYMWIKYTAKAIFSEYRKETTDYYFKMQSDWFKNSEQTTKTPDEKETEK